MFVFISFSFSWRFSAQWLPLLLLNPIVRIVSIVFRFPIWNFPNSIRIYVFYWNLAFVDLHQVRHVRKIVPYWHPNIWRMPMLFSPKRKENKIVFLRIVIHQRNHFDVTRTSFTDDFLLIIAPLFRTKIKWWREFRWIFDFLLLILFARATFFNRWNSFLAIRSFFSLIFFANWSSFGSETTKQCETTNTMKKTNRHCPELR